MVDRQSQSKITLIINYKFDYFPYIIFENQYIIKTDLNQKNLSQVMHAHACILCTSIECVFVCDHECVNMFVTVYVCVREKVKENIIGIF